MDIEGNVFIVTGGASGLGEGTARMLPADRAKILSMRCAAKTNSPSGLQKVRSLNSESDKNV